MMRYYTDAEEPEGVEHVAMMLFHTIENELYVTWPNRGCIFDANKLPWTRKTFKEMDPEMPNLSDEALRRGLELLIKRNRVWVKPDDDAASRRLLYTTNSSVWTDLAEALPPIDIDLDEYPMKLPSDAQVKPANPVEGHLFECNICRELGFVPAVIYMHIAMKQDKAEERGVEPDANGIIWVRDEVDHMAFHMRYTSVGEVRDGLQCLIDEGLMFYKSGEIESFYAINEAHHPLRNWRRKREPKAFFFD